MADIVKAITLHDNIKDLNDLLNELLIPEEWSRLHPRAKENRLTLIRAVLANPLAAEALKVTTPESNNNLKETQATRLLEILILNDPDAIQLTWMILTDLKLHSLSDVLTGEISLDKLKGFFNEAQLTQNELEQFIDAINNKYPQPDLTNIPVIDLLSLAIEQGLSNIALKLMNNDLHYPKKTAYLPNNPTSNCFTLRPINNLINLIIPL